LVRGSKHENIPNFLLFPFCCYLWAPFFFGTRFRRSRSGCTIQLVIECPPEITPQLVTERFCWPLNNPETFTIPLAVPGILCDNCRPNITISPNEGQVVAWTDSGLNLTLTRPGEFSLTIACPISGGTTDIKVEVGGRMPQDPAPDGPVMSPYPPPAPVTPCSPLPALRREIDFSNPGSPTQPEWWPAERVSRTGRWDAWYNAGLYKATYVWVGPLDTQGPLGCGVGITSGELNIPENWSVEVGVGHPKLPIGFAVAYTPPATATIRALSYQPAPGFEVIARVLAMRETVESITYKESIDYSNSDIRRYVRVQGNQERAVQYFMQKCLYCCP